MSEEPSGTVVLPLSPSTPRDPWRAVSEGTGLLVSWSDMPSGAASSWGPPLKATSALAQQLTHVLETSGGASALNGSAALFRLELPTGATMQNLVPAVGGGYRGLVRGVGNPGLRGDVRLLPVAGFAAPAIAMMGLSVGAEMLARQQQDQKLKSIHDAVSRLESHADETLQAQLSSAEQALESAMAALLDGAAIPSAIGLGSARDNLRVIRNRALTWMDEWSQGMTAITDPDVDLAKLKKVLSRQKRSTVESFPTQVEAVYRALVLDSRALVLTSAEASVKESGSLSALEEHIERQLAANVDAQARLREVLWQLAERPISMRLPARPGATREMYALDNGLTQLARRLSDLPDAPGLLGPSGRQVLEIARESSGRLSVLAPSA